MALTYLLPGFLPHPSRYTKAQSGTPIMEEPIHSFSVLRLGSDASPIYQLTSQDGSYSYTVHTSVKSKPHITMTKQIKCAPPPYPMPPAAGYSYPSSSTPVYNQTVGTANFHSLTGKIDVYFEYIGDEASPPTRHISMKRRNPLATTRQFNTGTRLGRLEWKESFLNSNQMLIDEQKRVLARYEKKRVSMLSSVKEETFVLCAPGLEPYVDLIVMTGFASVEYRRRSDDSWNEISELFEF